MWLGTILNENELENYLTLVQFENKLLGELLFRFGAYAIDIDLFDFGLRELLITSYYFTYGQLHFDISRLF